MPRRYDRTDSRYGRGVAIQEWTLESIGRLSISEMRRLRHLNGNLKRTLPTGTCRETSRLRGFMKKSSPVRDSKGSSDTVVIPSKLTSAECTMLVSKGSLACSCNCSGDSSKDSFS